MKRVGVVLRVEEINGITKHYVRNRLLDILSKHNIEIICIPIINSLDNIFNIINNCDGIILPGGDDVLEKNLRIVDYLYINDIPTLGICLGMQEMAVYKNATMTCINTKYHYNNEKLAHKIIINKNSILYSIINKEEYYVNSSHKCIIEKPELIISAKSDDNIIEAIEDSDRKCFIGVQWHPEVLNDKESRLLFNYFINSL